MFSPYYTSVSSLFSHYFLKSKIFSFDDVLFINIFFLVHAFGIVSKKSLPNQRSHKFPPLFSSVSFLFLAFAFMSMIFLRGFFCFVFFGVFFCILYKVRIKGQMTYDFFGAMSQCPHSIGKIHGIVMP